MRGDRCYGFWEPKRRKRKTSILNQNFHWPTLVVLAGKGGKRSHQIKVPKLGRKKTPNFPLNGGGKKGQRGKESSLRGGLSTMSVQGKEGISEDRKEEDLGQTSEQKDGKENRKGERLTGTFWRCLLESASQKGILKRGENPSRGGGQ